MLIKFELNEEIAFAINPDNITALHHYKSNKSDSWVVRVGYIDGTLEEILVTNSTVAIKLIDDIVNAANEVAQSLITLKTEEL